MNECSRKKLRAEKAKLERQRYSRLPGPAVIKTEKRCSRCKETKPIEQFAINKTAADWRASKCRPCAVIASAEWRKRNPEKVREHLRAQVARVSKLPDEKRLKHSRRWYAKNKAVAHKRSLEWRFRNRAAYNAAQSAYHKARLKRDPDYAFGVKIRAKMRLMLRGLRKSAPTEVLLGCKLSDFKKYLESLWEPWMSWGNYGGHQEGNWQIDHIVPIASFDLTDPEQQKLCFHYSNLRPLCSKKNREKWHTANPADLEALRNRINEMNQRKL